MKLAQIALRNPYTVIVGVLAVLVLGLTSIVRMPADMLPQFDTPAVQVVTFYPGMPAEVHRFAEHDYPRVTQRFSEVVAQEPGELRAHQPPTEVNHVSISQVIDVYTNVTGRGVGGGMGVLVGVGGAPPIDICSLGATLTPCASRRPTNTGSGSMN